MAKFKVVGFVEQYIKLENSGTDNFPEDYFGYGWTEIIKKDKNLYDTQYWVQGGFTNNKTKS